MCSESVRTRWRGCEVVFCARPVDNIARLDRDAMAVRPSVPPRRPRRGMMLHCSKLCGRTGVRWFARARPVDNIARQDLSVWTTRCGHIAVLTTHALCSRGQTADDPDTVAVKPSVPPRRPRQQNDASLHEAVRAHWREVIRRARPVDNTARLDLGVDTTARTELGVDTTAPVKPSVPPRRPRQQNHAALHEPVRARGRGGDVVHRARPVASAARPRRGAVRPSVPPWRPRQQNHAALHEAVTVDEATLWRLRVKRTAVAFGAVLLFVALVVFGGRPFGGDDQPAQPSVPSSGKYLPRRDNSNRHRFHLAPRVRIPKAHPAAHCHRPKACKRFQAALSRPHSRCHATKRESSAVVAATPP